jgi:glycosyltransferase involved in cell wall biosynthesis
MQIAEPLERAIARDVLRLPPDGFVVGWVGRMVPAKGLDVLIRALPELGDVRPVVCAIGSGPDRAPQEAIVKQYGHAVRVVWPGLVPDASRFYSAFDAFVLSSRTEGTPIALFEAMAAGVPIVTTRVGGVPQIVSQDEALIVPPENPSALAAAIRAVHDAPAAAATRARRARERLQAEFGADSWLAKHDEVYASVRR